MHGAAAGRGGYMDVPADIFAGAKMHGAAARRGGYMDVPADIPARSEPEWPKPNNEPSARATPVRYTKQSAHKIALLQTLPRCWNWQTSRI